MGVYRFDIVPSEADEPVELTFADDGEALAEARHALSDLMRDAARGGTTMIDRIEVRRDDGSLVGIVGY